MYNLDLLMMGLWGLKHVEERGNPDTVYRQKRIVYQVGNKDKINVQNIRIITTSNYNIPFCTTYEHCNGNSVHIFRFVLFLWPRRYDCEKALAHSGLFAQENIWDGDTWHHKLLSVQASLRQWFITQTTSATAHLPRLLYSSKQSLNFC
jgi:hypothetical protein